MKKLLLFTLLSVVTFGATAYAGNSLGDVVKASAKYVIDNPCKTAITLVVAYDVYKHGISESVVAYSANCLADNTRQLIENGHLFVGDVKSARDAVMSVVSKVTVKK